MNLVLGVNPALSNVVGEGSVAVIVAGEHEVALSLHLLSNLVEVIPVGDLSLNLGRIVSAENILSDVSSVSEEAGSCLPGNTLEIALGVGNNILGVLVLILQIVVGQRRVGTQSTTELRVHIVLF